MSMIFSLLGTVAKLLGLSEMAAKMYERAQQINEGKQLQAGADARATVDQATQANKIADRIAQESDQQAIDDLKKDARG